MSVVQRCGVERVRCSPNSTVDGFVHADKRKQASNEAAIPGPGARFSTKIPTKNLTNFRTKVRSTRPNPG